MNSVWLNLILKLLNMLAKSDLFIVERAALARQINPALLEFIEFLVGDIDGSDIPGAQKKGAVMSSLEVAPKDINVLFKTTADYLVNSAIEFAVRSLRK